MLNSIDAMKQTEPKIIPADISVRKNCLILFSLYVLLLLWLEPIIDFFLTLAPWDGSRQSLLALNEQKAMITTKVFVVARSIPILIFLWLGYRVFQAQALPPKGMRLPITVLVIEGAKAKMLGATLMVIALLLLLRELTLLV